ncbi:jg17448 [Pararge aegeria aegeria]|uniref:Jg17448 protein n=1 Tax=Pararge aegeria aegeria TaxID=348720 RepID=A0A8S4S1B5_9NEOP|nr:jg17448 [Pararge aegeria aegeria]
MTVQNIEVGTPMFSSIIAPLPGDGYKTRLGSLGRKELKAKTFQDFPVACSTVTVTKCQAALRTLQAFPFFKPTCLCREPNVDPECNSFRDFLFDHPCVFVMKKGKIL